MRGGVVDEIRAAGGEVYGITSEPQHLADQARKHWDLDFETVGDPHQEISRTCSERGWLTLYAQDSLEFLQRGAAWKVEHPKGFFQPGVLALTREGRVLYRWRSVPSSENMNGTVCRPTAEHVLRETEQALRAGAEAGDAAHDDHPEVDQKPLPVPIFIALLLANGWFVRVKSFAFSPDAPPIRRRFANAALRLVIFVLGWIAAAVWLPPLPVAATFFAWAAWVALDTRRIFGKMRRSRELAAEVANV